MPALPLRKRAKYKGEKQKEYLLKKSCNYPMSDACDVKGDLNKDNGVYELGM